MMKKNFVLLFFLLLFALISQAQTVYVTDKGKKFHKKNCSIVKEGKKGIELAQAKKEGYTACSVCKPEQVQATDPKKKTK